MTGDKADAMYRRRTTPSQRLNCGMLLDRRMREILLAATPETVLSSTAALVELGFSASVSFALVEKIVTAKR